MKAKITWVPSTFPGVIKQTLSVTLNGTETITDLNPDESSYFIDPVAEGDAIEVSLYCSTAFKSSSVITAAGVVPTQPVPDAPTELAVSFE